MVIIKEVKTKKDLRTFAAFNEKMYRDVPQAMPDLISDEISNFNPKKIRLLTMQNPDSGLHIKTENVLVE